MHAATSNITYTEMIVRFGYDVAYDLMRVIERQARGRDNIVYIDDDIRFQKALNALCDVTS